MCRRILRRTFLDGLSWQCRLGIETVPQSLRIRLLEPVDFVIAKLRRGIELDLDDALYVVRRFQISRSDIEQAAAAAIAASPEDTALFLFQKTVELFCRQLPEQML